MNDDGTGNRYDKAIYDERLKRSQHGDSDRPHPECAARRTHESYTPLFSVSSIHIGCDDDCDAPPPGHYRSCRRDAVRTIDFRGWNNRHRNLCRQWRRSN